MRKKNNMTGLLFAGPFLIGFLLFTLYPTGASLFYSFTNFNLFKPLKWIGLENYKWIIEEKEVLISIRNTMYMVIIATPVSLAVGLFMAMLLNTKVRGQSIFRTLFYIPSIVPVIASSLVWMWVLNPQSGMINSILKIFGVNGPNWLLDAAWTKPSLILMLGWGSGGIMIIFLAALQEVPRSLYEAADIDGSGELGKFYHVTLPSISPIILFQLIMSLITYFQFFAQAFMLSSLTASGPDQSMSGPENSLLFYAILLYREAFVDFSMGHASAMAWVLFLITGIVTWLVFKTSKKWVTYGGE
ncbi:carbohydrate ABC transporter permease [Paenibacillus monticola]|uniref:ABC transporter permease subunit n=1 Tax=Paenibacillus monticola TaxID=2666075 RepID=A0A7X2H469_9BACL|nr:sugar ABC transporter permease [Paenibacillus monticola]MRN53266.1 ABC transporter permease subunit [Paenibacillus monticola]